MIPSAALRQANALILAARREGREFLLEHEAKSILAAARVRITKERACRDLTDALRASRGIGYPVVMKVISPQVVHKTDVAGVLLDIRTPRELRAAYGKLLKAVQTRVKCAEIRGVLVQEMVAGREVTIGCVRDRLFGPVIMFGLGGVFVEIASDVVFRLLPVNLQEVQTMISEIRGSRILQEFRGQKKIRVASLARLVVRIGDLFNELKEISELDLNPVFVNSGKAVVADARMKIA